MTTLEPRVPGAERTRLGEASAFDVPALYTKHANVVVARWKLRQDLQRNTLVHYTLSLFYKGRNQD